MHIQSYQFIDHSPRGIASKILLCCYLRRILASWGFRELVSLRCWSGSRLLALHMRAYLNYMSHSVLWTFSVTSNLLRWIAHNIILPVEKYIYESLKTFKVFSSKKLSSYYSFDFLRPVSLKFLTNLSYKFWNNLIAGLVREKRYHLLSNCSNRLVTNFTSLSSFRKKYVKSFDLPEISLLNGSK